MGGFKQRSIVAVSGLSPDDFVFTFQRFILQNQQLEVLLHLSVLCMDLAAATRQLFISIL